MSRIGFAFLLILTISPSAIAQNEQDEHTWNPIFLSSLDFLKFPVPTADATATTEEEARLYEPDAEVWKTYHWMGGRE